MTKLEAVTQFNQFTNKGFKPAILVNNEGDYKVTISNVFLKPYLAEGYIPTNLISDKYVTYNTIREKYKLDKDIYITIKKDNYLLNVRESKFDSSNGLIMINDRPVKCNVYFAENFLIINYMQGDLLKSLHYAYIECEF